MQNPQQAPFQEPFPRTLPRNFSQPFLEACGVVRPLRHAPKMSLANEHPPKIFAAKITNFMHYPLKEQTLPAGPFCLF